MMGKCPYCKSDDISYGALEPEDTLMYYPISCNTCGKEGKEWYTMEYAETTKDD